MAKDTSLMLAHKDGTLIAWRMRLVRCGMWKSMAFFHVEEFDQLGPK
jgi:hypothetical protein